MNTCLKRERRKKLENWISLEFLFQEKEQLHPMSPMETPDQQIEIAEKEQIVQKTIHSLPERQKNSPDFASL